MLLIRSTCFFPLLLIFFQLRSCDASCSDQIEGVQDDNVLDVIPNVQDEGECLSMCAAADDCLFYTYYSETDPVYPNWCFHLSHIQEPLKVCQHCTSGPVQCDQAMCGMILTEGSSIMESLMVDTVGNTSIHIVRLGDACHAQLYIWAVGGGGAGGLYAGGGSGMVKDGYHDPGNSRDLVITTGGPGQPSLVTNNQQEEILRAGNGGNAWWQHGGNGYSGGGGGGDFASAGARGGSDGGNGGSWTGAGGGGGVGSGVDVRLNDLEVFSLSPGGGGSGGGGCDGGGGGVNVFNRGPTRANANSGSGYGGGGGSCNGETYGAHPGVVLLELIEK